MEDAVWSVWGSLRLAQIIEFSGSYVLYTNLCQANKFDKSHSLESQLESKGE